MRVVTFGEVMLRLAPEGFVRLRQAVPGRLEATFGGGELNVAVSIALQGGRSAFLTAVPDNVVTDALVQEMRKVGVDADLVMRRSSGRFGIYFVETGAIPARRDGDLRSRGEFDRRLHGERFRLGGGVSRGELVSHHGHHAGDQRGSGRGGGGGVRGGQEKGAHRFVRFELPQEIVEMEAGRVCRVAGSRDDAQAAVARRRADRE